MRHFMAMAMATALFCAPASAQDLSSAAAASDDLWKELENLPPRASYDLAVDVSFGDITYWRNRTGPYLGFGIKTGWGQHLGESRKTRVGGGAYLGLEGPVPQYFSGVVEPQFTVDRVANHVLLGASLGPSVMFHSTAARTGQETTLGLAPMVSGRVGWSQAWSRVARRMFVYVEPKFRVVAGLPSWQAAVVVGSGDGY